MIHSEVEQLAQDLHGILRPTDSVASRPRIIVDLVVIPTLEGLVSKEMNGLVVNAGQSPRRICLRLNMLKTVRLVPAMREHVE